MKPALPFALFFFACGGSAPTPEEKPGQADALQIVWNEMFHATSPAPPITWHEDSCSYGDASVHVVVDSNGKCYYGLYWPMPSEIAVAWPTSQKFGDAAFVHELLHAWQGDRGIFDYDHTSPEWDMIAPTNAQLASAGL